MRLHGARIARRVLGAVGLFLLIGGVDNNGCVNHGDATSPKTYVDESCPGPGCDENAKSAPDPTGDAVQANCGNPGQCPCSLGTDGYCAMCPSAPADAVCRYCAPTSYCPKNPCSATCERTPNCPASAPVDCGSDKCCPKDHPVCCPGKSLCATDSASCNPPTSSDDNNNDNNNSSGCGIPPGGCASAGLSNAQLKTGCCSRSGCFASCTDECQSWYEAGGRIYGPCPVGNNSCLQNAATNVGRACQ